MADGGLAAAAAVPKGSLWTAEEDSVLVNYITANGAGSWDKVARATGLNRSGKSCRLRWRNYLRPDLRRDEMTAEEKAVVVRLHSQWGNKWCKIAKQLPGRSEKEVIKFWKTNNMQQQEHKLKKRLLRQHDKAIDITPAGSCSGVDNNDGGTPATTTEGQRSRSSSSNNSGQSGGGGGGGTAGGGTPGAGGGATSAAAMGMDYFFFRDLLAAQDDDALKLKGTFYLTAAPGKYLDFWSTSPSCLGNNDSATAN